MIVFLFVTAIVLMTPVSGVPSGSLRSVAVTGEDTKITERARTEFAAWQKGRIERSRYSLDLNAHVSDGMLARFSGRLQEFGALRTISFEHSTFDGPTEVYTYRLGCAKGTIVMNIGIDQLGRITVISFKDADREKSSPA